MAQKEIAAEVWARRMDWRPYTLNALDDTLELPEFGFSTSLRSICAGTRVGGA